ncbi:MAG: hypothetical protein H6937_02515 [Burkholderiales bacterium]|nr:hypothetical protein [Burkholderiales bacterium]
MRTVRNIGIEMNFKSIESAPKNKSILLGYKNGDIEIGCYKYSEFSNKWRFFPTKAGAPNRQPIAWCEYPSFDPREFCQNISNSNEWIEFNGTPDQIEEINHARNGIKIKNSEGEVSEIFRFSCTTLGFMVKMSFDRFGATHYMLVE